MAKSLAEIRARYEPKLTISIEGSIKKCCYTTSKVKIAKGYSRVVIGERGPYLEFFEHQIYHNRLYIPDEEWWRINSAVAYYVELRSTDKANVKVYHQKRRVDYADYIIGLYYISPFDLQDKDGCSFIRQQDIPKIKSLWE